MEGIKATQAGDPTPLVLLTPQAWNLPSGVTQVLGHRTAASKGTAGKKGRPGLGEGARNFCLSWQEIPTSGASGEMGGLQPAAFAQGHTGDLSHLSAAGGDGCRHLRSSDSKRTSGSPERRTQLQDYFKSCVPTAGIYI